MKKLNINKIFKSEINEHISNINFFLENNFDEFKKFLDLVIKTLKKGNKIILFGNGGSASDAQHIAAELVVKYKKRRKSIPAIYVVHQMHCPHFQIKLFYYLFLRF